MKRASPTLIELTETIYDLETEDGAWMPSLLEVALPLFDMDLGIATAAYSRDASGFTMHQRLSCGGPPDFLARSSRAVSEWPPEVFAALMRPGIVATLSELIPDHPQCLDAYRREMDGCEDVLGMTAVDPNGLGILLIAILPKVTTLRGSQRNRWKMIGAHLAAGHRLRRAVVAELESGALPHRAEAVIDPNNFTITDAVGDAATNNAAEALREAAVQLDRARGSLRKSDPTAALETWKSLTDGRWSLVDWFDSDDRRFVLALPNAPEVTDPRGLSERENLVATYTIHGDSGKLIGYRLGISTTSVSTALHGAMQKLGVKTRTQLVERFSAFETPPTPASPSGQSAS